MQNNSKINDDYLYHELVSYANEQIKVIKLIMPLRDIDLTDSKTARVIIDSIFENVILRFDPEFEKKYIEYNINNQEIWNDIITVIDSITTFLVIKKLKKGIMSKVIHNNLRLSQDTCNYIEKKIEDNYSQIQYNLILSKLYSD